MNNHSAPLIFYASNGEGIEDTLWGLNESMNMALSTGQSTFVQTMFVGVNTLHSYYDISLVVIKLIASQPLLYYLNFTWWDFEGYLVPW